MEDHATALQHSTIIIRHLLNVYSTKTLMSQIPFLVKLRVQWNLDKWYILPMFTATFNFKIASFSIFCQTFELQLTRNQLISTVHRHEKQTTVLVATQQHQSLNIHGDAKIQYIDHQSAIRPLCMWLIFAVASLLVVTFC